MNKEKVVVSKDKDGNRVEVLVRRPSFKDQEAAQIEYNRAFRDAVKGGSFLKSKLHEFLVEQELWDDKKQKRYEELVNMINSNELLLKKGGIKLSLAKEVALDLSDARKEFNQLFSERTALDDKSAEGAAESARFNHLLINSLFNPETKQKMFKDKEEYNQNYDQPWVSDAAAEFGVIFYDIDPNYEGSLVENKFLKDHKFVDEKLRFINKEGHLTDREGKLVDEDGKYIKYVDGKKVFVNWAGEEVNVEFSPFLEDDEEKPVEVKKTEVENHTENSVETP